MKKPSSCEGCPLYGNGEGYVPDLNNNAHVTIAMSHPSNEEVKLGKSATGGAWTEIKNKYLPILGENEINISHVIRCRDWVTPGKGGRVLPWWLEKPNMSKQIKEAVEHCKTHDKLIMNEELIIAQGELGHYKYGGKAKDDAPYNWRGHLLPDE